jgi:RNA polymerase sigma-70 factor (ECF subfamily)
VAASTLRVIGPPDDSLTWRLVGDLDGVFAEVVADFQGAVFTTALRMSGVPGDAEELVAETFLKAFEALRRYPPERVVDLQLRPWLVTICLNLGRNRVRASSRRPVVAPFPEPAVFEPRSSDESPEDRTVRHDQGDHLAAQLLHLPVKQRSAVVLRHIVGLSYAEVAEVLGCPLGTAKSHVRRGLDRLRADLSPEPEVLR